MLCTLGPGLFSNHLQALTLADQPVDSLSPESPLIPSALGVLKTMRNGPRKEALVSHILRFLLSSPPQCVLSKHCSHVVFVSKAHGGLPIQCHLIPNHLLSFLEHG